MIEIEPYPCADLNQIVNQTSELLPKIQGKRILVTGGSGFFGSWILQALQEISRQEQVPIPTWTTTRSPEKAQALRIFFEDWKDFEVLTEWSWPEVDWVVHLADHTNIFSSEEQGAASSVDQFNHDLLEWAEQSLIQKFLYASSGGVYQPIDEPRGYTEEDPVFTEPPNEYIRSKIQTETAVVQKLGDRALIARCFSFIGPGLPLDQHYAAGNFMANALNSEPIKIKGDGTPVRSYLYPSDLTNFLLTLLARPNRHQICNIGSEDPVTIAQLAQEISNLNPEIPIPQPSLNPTPPAQGQTTAPRTATHLYYPSCQRFQKEFGLQPTVTRDNALQKHYHWLNLVYS